MPIFTYQCKACGFKEDYLESFSAPKEMKHPETCPKCEKEKLEKVFDCSGQSFMIWGYCYDNVYGKRNWKQGKTESEIASYLVPDANGNMKDPW